MTETTWERAAYVRMLSGRTQEAIGEAAGIYPGHLAEYEAGICNLTPLEFTSLAAALGVAIAVLTDSGRFREWLGDRPLPTLAETTLLGVLSNASPTRVNRPGFRAFAAGSVADLNESVAFFLGELQPEESLLMVAPMSVTILDDGKAAPYDERIIYTTTIVYSAPDPVHD